MQSIKKKVFFENLMRPARVKKIIKKKKKQTVFRFFIIVRKKLPIC